MAYISSLTFLVSLSSVSHLFFISLSCVPCHMHTDNKGRTYLPTRLGWGRFRSNSSNNYRLLLKLFDYFQRKGFGFSLCGRWGVCCTTSTLTSMHTEVPQWHRLQYDDKRQKRIEGEMRWRQKVEEGGGQNKTGTLQRENGGEKVFC